MGWPFTSAARQASVLSSRGLIDVEVGGIMLGGYRRLSVAIAAYFCVLVPAHSAGLYDVYKLALENDPVYQIGHHEKEASSEVYRQARALLLPQVSIDLSRSKIHQNILSADNAVFAAGKTTYPETNIGIKVQRAI